MALPIEFPQVNRVYNKPDNCMTDEQCFSLPVFEHTREGFKETISFWKFNKEELEEINKEGGAWVGVCGGQPPIWISGENPFNDNGNS